MAILKTVKSSDNQKSINSKENIKEITREQITTSESVLSLSSSTSNKSLSIQHSFIEFDRDESNEKIGTLQLCSKHKLLGLLCLMVAFGGFVFGWDTGTISGFVQMKTFKEQFGDYNEDSTSHEFTTTKMGLIISIFNIGCAIGGLTLANLGDKFGRKIGLICAMGVYIVGIILQISANHWVQFMVGRIVVGVAVGTITVLSPMFIAETAPSEIRGLAVSFYQLMITLGILLGYVTTFGTIHSFTDDRQWKIPVGMCFVWTLIISGGMYFLPESSRYLIEKGKLEKARSSVAKINNLPKDDQAVTRELELINNALVEQRAAGDVSWKEVFTGKPHLCTRVLIGITLQTFQQLNGNNFFFYYGTSIFQSIGLEDSYLTSIILGAVNFGSTLIALYTIGKISRRQNLIFGAVGMSLCLFIFSIVGVTCVDSNESSNAGIGMIILTCAFIFIFAITWAPGVFVVLAETYPLRIRSKGIALATAANWIWGFLIAFFTPMIVNKIKFTYCFVFAGSTIFAGLFVYFLVPETSGLTLEQVDILYKHYSPGLASRAFSIAQENIITESNVNSYSNAKIVEEMSPV